MKIKNIKYFKIAAECGSFAQAAKILNVSASSIGYAVDNLETLLKTSLFVRRPSNGVKLTPDGRVLLEKCHATLHAVEDIEHHFSTNKQMLAGKLVVGCQEGLSWSLVPRAICKLSIRHPKLQIIMKSTWMDTGTELLDSGELDLLVTFFDDNLPSSVYSTTLICNLFPIVMMRKGHPLDDGNTEVSIKALAQFPQIMINDGPALTHFRKMFLESGLNPNVHMYSNISTATQAVVGCTDSVSLRAIKPKHQYSPLGDRLVFKTLIEPQKSANLAIVTNKSRFEVSHTKHNAFIQTCRDLIDTGEMKDQFNY